ENVAETGGGDQADLGAPPLEQGVKADRCSMEKELGFLDDVLGHVLGDRIDHPMFGRGGHCWDLSLHRLTRPLVEIDEIGECAANIDTNTRCHFEYFLLERSISPSSASRGAERR